MVLGAATGKEGPVARLPWCLCVFFETSLHSSLRWKISALGMLSATGRGIGDEGEQPYNLEVSIFPTFARSGFDLFRHRLSLRYNIARWLLHQPMLYRRAYDTSFDDILPSETTLLTSMTMRNLIFYGTTPWLIQVSLLIITPLASSGQVLRPSLASVENSWCWFFYGTTPWLIQVSLLLVTPLASLGQVLRPSLASIENSWCWLCEQHLTRCTKPPSQQLP